MSIQTNPFLILHLSLIGKRTSNNDSFLVIKNCLIILLVLLNGRSLSLINALELRANCGFPGKPYRAKIIPEEKLYYEEGETVSYQCADYWAPPQMRKCVNGVWVGPPARCGNFVHNVQLMEAKVLDMSFGLPIEKFHYHNISLKNTNWKYPNSFTSNGYREHRLIATSDHEYMWKLKFTRSAIKLFVKVNFNFINFTILDSTIRNNFSFYIDVEISPYRTCNLEYQSNNPWQENGNRIDSYFTCEAHSYTDLIKDVNSASDYMIMRTKSSHNIPYELVELFFGHVYGNETEPICGEPETDYGQSYRANQEYRNYIVECLNGIWKDVTPGPLKRFVYHQQCIGDMIWNGTRPKCIPIRHCPIQKMLSDNHRNQEMEKNQTNPMDKNPLIIDAILNYYNHIDNQTIYAIVGTEIIYTCPSVDYILIGKDTRTCKRDMTWSGTEPICKFIKTTNDNLDSLSSSSSSSSNYLIVIIICMGILLLIILIASCLLILYCNKHWNISKKEETKSNVISNNNITISGCHGIVNGDNEWQLENYYDNIEMNFNQKNDVFYDIYESVDHKEHNSNNLSRYAETNQYFYGQPTIAAAGIGSGPVGSHLINNNNDNTGNNNNNTSNNSNNNNNSNVNDNDYIRMLGNISVKVEPTGTNNNSPVNVQTNVNPIQTIVSKDSKILSSIRQLNNLTNVNNSTNTNMPINNPNSTTSNNNKDIGLGGGGSKKKTKPREPSYLEVMQ